MPPDVTFILPVRNGEPYLKECLASVVGQSYQDWRLLILDNCSSDKTRELCDAYKDDPRLVYLCNENDIGAPANFLKGLRMCDTRYFALVSHDDKYINHTAVMQARQILEKNPNVAAVYSHMHWIDEKSIKIHALKFSPVGVVNSDKIALRSIIRCRNLFGVPLLARTEYVASYSPDPRLYYTSDIEYSLIMGRDRDVYVLDSFCYAIRFHKSNNTMRNFRFTRKELAYMAQKHGIKLNCYDRIAMHANNLWMMAQKFCFFLYLDYFRR